MSTDQHSPHERATPSHARESEPAERSAARAYWRANLKLMAVLLGIWFTVSFGFGILLVEPLNRIDFFGFPFGFWWAQQGSIYVFIVLIFVYAVAMRRLDRKYDVHEHEAER